MSIELKVPTVGESITEVEIGEWLKKEGDAVGKDEPVAVLESEKASVELLSPEDGVLGRIVKASGEVCAIGAVVALIEAGGGGGAVANDGSKDVEDENEAEDDLTDDSRVMPSAELALAEHGLKAEDVEATGPGGRLLKEDVLRHIENNKSAAAPAAPEPEPEPAAPAPNPAPAAPTPVETSGARQEEAVRMSRLRRTVARRVRRGLEALRQALGE